MRRALPQVTRLRARRTVPWRKLIKGTLDDLVDIIGTLVKATFDIPGPNVGPVEGQSFEVSPTLASTFGA